MSPQSSHPIINPRLKQHIETHIFPLYAKNEPAHNLNHIKYVISRSFKFARTIPDINYDMVYTIAAYHDIGHHIDPKTHELISGQIMSEDKTLATFFSSTELKTIREAIEDHRSSSGHEPRSIYGRIVSTADRNITVNACLSRSYTYGQKLHPDFTDNQLFENAHHHLSLKFGENGYAKFFFKDEEYENFLKEIRKLLANKDLFIQTQRAHIHKLKHDGLI